MRIDIKPMEQPKIAVIVINWNGKHLLHECLSSVEDQDYGNFKIILIDNGSTDGSCKFVNKNFPGIEIIELGKNTGFAYANNIGIHRAFEDPETEYIAILNNDAMTGKSWLYEMMKVARNDERTGSVAPKILKYWRRDVIDSVGDMIHLDGTGISNHINEIDRGRYDTTAEVFGISGCSCMFSRKMLEDIRAGKDFFDSDFFLYLEEVDLNWRARLRGWRCYTAPSAIVFHKHSETVGLYSPLKAYFVNRNRFFVIIKNYPLFLIPKAFLNLFSRYFYSIKSIKRNKGSSARLLEKTSLLKIVRIVLAGWLGVAKYAPKMIIKRYYIQKNRMCSIDDVERWVREYKTDLKDVAYDEHVV